MACGPLVVVGVVVVVALDGQELEGIEEPPEQFGCGEKKTWFT